MTRSRRCPHCLGTGFAITLGDVLDGIPAGRSEAPRARPGACGAPWWDLTVDPPISRVCTTPTRGGRWCADHQRQRDWIAARRPA